jgi:diguanylate cyclase (GGDEF)-like protein
MGRVEHRIAGPDGARWARWWWRSDGPRLYLCAIDVHDEHHLERELVHRATHDPLTGLANRSELLSVLERALGREAISRRPFALVFLDLDGFKSVNDSAGHQAGDDVLVTVAHAIVDAIRPFDLAARLGGDEFAVICHGVGSEDEAQELADRVRGAIAQATAEAGWPVTATAGVAISSRSETSPDSVLARADRNMYRAKGAGRTHGPHAPAHDLSGAGREAADDSFELRGLGAGAAAVPHRPVPHRRHQAHG